MSSMLLRNFFVSAPSTGTTRRVASTVAVVASLAPEITLPPSLITPDNVLPLDELFTRAHTLPRQWNCYMRLLDIPTWLIDGLTKPVSRIRVALASCGAKELPNPQSCGAKGLPNPQSCFIGAAEKLELPAAVVYCLKEEVAKLEEEVRIFTAWYPHYMDHMARESAALAREIAKFVASKEKEASLAKTGGTRIALPPEESSTLGASARTSPTPPKSSTLGASARTSPKPPKNSTLGASATKPPKSSTLGASARTSPTPPKNSTLGASATKPPQSLTLSTSLPSLEKGVASTVAFVASVPKTTQPLSITPITPDENERCLQIALSSRNEFAGWPKDKLHNPYWVIDGLLAHVSKCNDFADIAETITKVLSLCKAMRLDSENSVEQGLIFADLISPLSIPWSGGESPTFWTDGSSLDDLFVRAAELVKYWNRYLRLRKLPMKFVTKFVDGLKMCVSRIKVALALSGAKGLPNPQSCSIRAAEKLELPVAVVYCLKKEVAKLEDEIRKFNAQPYPDELHFMAREADALALKIAKFVASKEADLAKTGGTPLPPEKSSTLGASAKAPSKQLRLLSSSEKEGASSMSRHAPQR